MKYEIKRIEKLIERAAFVLAEVPNKSRNVPTPKGKRRAERIKDMLLNINNLG